MVCLKVFEENWHRKHSLFWLQVPTSKSLINKRT